MPFFFLGIIILLLSIYFMRMAIRDRDKEGVVGLTALIIASLILIIFFGLFFRSVI